VPYRQSPRSVPSSPQRRCPRRRRTAPRPGPCRSRRTCAACRRQRSSRRRARTPARRSLPRRTWRWTGTSRRSSASRGRRRCGRGSRRRTPRRPADTPVTGNGRRSRSTAPTGNRRPPRSRRTLRSRRRPARWGRTRRTRRRCAGPRRSCWRGTRDRPCSRRRGRSRRNVRGRRRRPGRGRCERSYTPPGRRTPRAGRPANPRRSGRRPGTADTAPWRGRSATLEERSRPPPGRRGAPSRRPRRWRPQRLGGLMRRPRRRERRPPDGRPPRRSADRLETHPGRRPSWRHPVGRPPRARRPTPPDLHRQTVRSPPDGSDPPAVIERLGANGQRWQACGAKGRSALQRGSQCPPRVVAERPDVTTPPTRAASRTSRPWGTRSTCRGRRTYPGSIRPATPVRCAAGRPAPATTSAPIERTAARAGGCATRGNSAWRASARRWGLTKPTVDGRSFTSTLIRATAAAAIGCAVSARIARVESAARSTLVTRATRRTPTRPWATSRETCPPTRGSSCQR